MADDTGGTSSVLGLLNIVSRCALGYSTLVVATSTSFSPLSWVVASFAIWTSFAFTKTWSKLGVWDKRQMLWGLASAALLLLFIKHDADFKVINSGWWNRSVRMVLRLPFATLVNYLFALAPSCELASGSIWVENLVNTF
jgi:hypothetical protein